MTTLFRRFSISSALTLVAAFCMFAALSVAAFAAGGYTVNYGTCTDGTTNICGNSTCSVVNGYTLNGTQYCYAYGCKNDTASQKVSFCLTDSSAQNGCTETFSNDDTTKCTLSSCFYWTCTNTSGICTTSLSGGTGSCRCPSGPNNGGKVPMQMFWPVSCTQT